ncbi:MAG TPA: glycoside hydrolase family 30 protein [Rudaea sp.]
MKAHRGVPTSLSRRSLLKGAAALVGSGALAATALGNTRGNGGWRLIETARDSAHRLTAVAEPRKGPSGAAAIRCDPRRTAQAIIGFGGALTESAAHVLQQLPDDRRRAVLRAYYDLAQGIGYTLARTPMTSCDFSLSSWSLDDVAGDLELKHFSLEPMRARQLPLIRDVQQIAGAGKFRLLASPWSPPGWMKTSGNMLRGGSLRADCADAWAAYYVRFVQAMRDEHLPVWALTVQNEPDVSQPWESCRYSPHDEADFIARHLGPALQHARLGDIRLYGWDHNRDGLLERASALLGDPACAKYLAGLALHWYGEELFDASRQVLAKFPDTQILFTEGCVEGGPHAGEWAPAERYARNMIGDFSNGICGFIDWNIALDMQGGPNHVGNFCHAPVLVDAAAGAVHYQPSFYYIAHFSRFVRPGAKLVGLSNDSSVAAIAFVNPDQSVVVIVVNPADDAADFSLAVADDTRSCRVPAHAIQTYLVAR